MNIFITTDNHINNCELPGLHEATRVHSDRVAGHEEPGRVLVAGVRLRVRCRSRAMCASSRLDQLPALLARDPRAQKVRARVHDRAHQPQPLHQHQDLGEY